MNGITKVDGSISFPSGNTTQVKPQEKVEMIKPIEEKDVFVKSQPVDEAMQKYLQEQEQRKQEFEVLIQKPQKFNIDIKA